MPDSLRFQHFEVLQDAAGKPVELGRGAMGITYRALDTNLHCEVALKVIRPELLSGPNALDRFLREARAAAAIRHPNVATVLHLGEASGTWFYAMEFVDGETAAERIRRVGPLPPKLALEIGLQVAKALAAAERQGLVHRDIKPQNIMLASEPDGAIHVKVIDFGLAKPVTSSDSDQTLTYAGFLGTPHFASPEQLEERPLDIRSDFYSLGVTLVVLLTGKPLFSGTMAQVMGQHLHKTPELNESFNLAPDLADLLHSLLAKNPDDRPADAAALLAAIQRCQNSAQSTPLHSDPTPDLADDPLMETTGDLDTLTPVIPTLKTGFRLADRFELGDEFQPGEFGRTFHAINLETQESVAILILRDDLLPTSEACTRLENEINALQRITHPAVLRVRSIERIGTLAWISREWVDDDSLAYVAASGGFSSANELIDALADLADGLDAVQNTGVPCPELIPSWIFVPEHTRKNAPLVKFNPINLSGISPRSLTRSRPQATDFAATMAQITKETFALAGFPLAKPSLIDRARNPATDYTSAGEFFSDFEAAQKRGPKLRAVLIFLILAAMAAIAATIALRWSPSSLTPPPIGHDDSEFLPPPTPDPGSDAAPTPIQLPESIVEPTPPPAWADASGRAQNLTAEGDFAAALLILAEIQSAHPEAASEITAQIEITASALLAASKTIDSDTWFLLRDPIEQAALAGSLSAQRLTAQLLESDDPEAAFPYFVLAADAGDRVSAASVARMFAEGRGTNQNPELAFEYFSKAAQRGDQAAAVEVAERLATGNGTPVNPDQAARHFEALIPNATPTTLTALREAAARENPMTIYYLARLLESGSAEIPADPAEAKAFYNLATELGYKVE